jgi:sporulation protein YlmC with PRC-barrel domain
MKSTIHPNRAFISSEDVEGCGVYDKNGNSIGEVDHLMIEKESGRVVYAVISFGGFLGLGHSHYPLPWAKLSYDTDLGGFTTDVTEQQLKDSPAFSDDSWDNRTWEGDVHSYYDVPPYWGR